MPLPITGLYLAVLAVFGSVLAFLAARIRGAEGISVGDGGRMDLLVAMRRHSNFVEYVPFFMIMLAALELNGTSAAALHGLGLGMLVSRTCHAVGLKPEIQSVPRGIGAGGTMLLTLIAAGMLVQDFVQS
jgi:uncharacterized membrane protein YecN with MAPEG domain